MSDLNLLTENGKVDFLNPEDGDQQNATFSATKQQESFLAGTGPTTGSSATEERTAHQPKDKLLTRLRELRAEAHLEDGFAFFDAQDPIETLDWATANGFVFHGSTRRIKGELVPQQANDTEKESGNREAVYMTKKPILAEFTALTGGKDMGGRQNQVLMDISDSGKVTYPKEPIFKVGKLEEVADEGFVYVFDSTTQVDEDVNGESLSYRPVKPLAAIRIKKEDFRYPITKI